MVQYRPGRRRLPTGRAPRRRARARHRPEPPGWPSARSSLWIVYFAVPDIDTAVGQAALLGASPPMSLPGPEPAVLLADNQGALFGLQAVRPT